MTKPIISVENLSKAYRLGLKEEVPDTLVSAMAGVAKAPFKNFRRLSRLDTSGHDGSDDDILWALKDVNFEVNQGEVVGIIGRNGAGKSTLLKILSRITDPTSGCVKLRGRVSSLLEVGTGFHPELTGRDNIYMNGTILGMMKKEIDCKFDEIVDFSGVEKFLDTPVKRYSSGMQVRLAFAVAAHLEPEILIVDEVLAVGDAEFQKKCIGKMQNVAGEGRTVLFVSHNMDAISRLTRRCVLLSSGTVNTDSTTSDAIHEYLLANQSTSPYQKSETNALATIKSVHIETSHPNNVQQHGEAMSVAIEIQCASPIPGARVACRIKNELGNTILHLNISDSDHNFARKSGSYLLRCKIPEISLYKGRYNLEVHFAQSIGLPKLDYIENAGMFEIVMNDLYRANGWPDGLCAYIENTAWSVEQGERQV